MALLARAPVALLEQRLPTHLQNIPRQWLRAPETGLYMVQGRVGGSGARFNLGELTVTRCALRCLADGVTPPPVGVAYVLGRSPRHAELAALIDALVQIERMRTALEQAVLEPLRQHLDDERTRRHAAAQSTRVNFFTLAREADLGEKATSTP